VQAESADVSVVHSDVVGPSAEHVYVAVATHLIALVHSLMQPLPFASLNEVRQSLAQSLVAGQFADATVLQEAAHWAVTSAGAPPSPPAPPSPLLPHILS
jgi:hypothetical protein